MSLSKYPRPLAASMVAMLLVAPIAVAQPRADGGEVQLAMDMQMNSSGSMGNPGSGQGSMGQTSGQPSQGMSGGGMGCCMGRMKQGSSSMGGMGMNDDKMRMGGMGQGSSGTGSGGSMRMEDDKMGMSGSQPMPGMTPNGMDMTDRIDGRIAFLRAELKITDAQAASWNQFAEALRSSRKHLLEAREQLASPTAESNPATRIEQYERHLAARLEAIRTARTSFSQLYAGLDQHQKHVADELVVPFLATF
ncbi:Spy/CpxP family protein refolding chaperone [Enterovirga aerilata]|uniref:Spy/CpxP family protein refolding chaperone n=1 Tax=Enterovirga aerilata TaxID=2730920 RepID=A0A849ICD1_9HYPH|nr:Spy/CpxP family protein refolding chaperone [Enterovirga sp. DB1703]NNM73905.1 Spy/CpxP family protein refolding chaperone [Enterovirga sp. DB1703]